ncbi:MAG: hypothetical protein H8E41_02195 [Desulfobulbaceae bacterium]|uniref:Uncharacterized protein n=1 Tax=Candidatus Desulfobia pelagia TaxID=2841692 RepID=A0A8J6TEP9_9BACT|nr:hypothetical protein [Candidatus Desulfobia pelagia]
MGGYGSGQKCDSKKTTGSQYMIDIRWMKKQGLLVPGTSGSMSWECRGKETGDIGYRVENNRLILQYQNKHRGGEWESIEDEISFTWTPCNYGGKRQWFLCPKCNRRIAVIYGGKFYRCRHCYDLVYDSQQENTADRLMRKARKIRRRLGGSNNLMEPILFKPKNMHQKTFDRLRKEADSATNLSCLIIRQRFGFYP